MYLVEVVIHIRVYHTIQQDEVPRDQYHTNNHILVPIHQNESLFHLLRGKRERRQTAEKEIEKRWRDR